MWRLNYPLLFTRVGHLSRRCLCVLPEYVALTLMLIADGRCTLTIDSTSTRADHIAWYTIYRAATQLEAICVLQRKYGRIINLGK